MDEAGHLTAPGNTLRGRRRDITAKSARIRRDFITDVQVDGFMGPWNIDKFSDVFCDQPYNRLLAMPRKAPANDETISAGN